MTAHSLLRGCILGFALLHLVAFSETAHAQFDSTAFRPEVWKVVKELEQSPWQEDLFTGRPMGVTPLREEFHRLVKLASPDELEMLLQHPQTHMQGYAFEAMALTGHRAVYATLVDWNDDSRKIKVREGCTTFAKDLFGFALHRLDDFRVLPGLDKLTKEEKEKLDSLLMAQMEATQYVNWRLLELVQPNAAHRDKVREWVLEDSSAEGMSVLASYQTEEDIPLLLGMASKKDELWPEDDFVTSDMKCSATFARHFPHRKFKALVQAHFEEEVLHGRGVDMEGTAEALACYPSNSTAKLFEEAYANAISQAEPDEDRLRALRLALELHPHRCFEELLTQLRDIAPDPFWVQKKQMELIESADEVH